MKTKRQKQLEALSKRSADFDKYSNALREAQGILSNKGILASEDDRELVKELTGKASRARFDVDNLKLSLGIK